MKKRLPLLLLVLAMLVCLLPACKPADPVGPSGDDKEGIPYAIIKIRDYGTIEVKLEPEIAPITVANFIKLAESGYYDGLSFHRIVNGFMMQGGWDLNGEKPPVDTIKGEFTANGVNNTIAHERGVISMARAKAYNSASSQFFICQVDCPSLDGDYAAFGRVTEGIEIVDAICNTIPRGVDGTLKEEYRAWIDTVTIEYRAK